MATYYINKTPQRTGEHEVHQSNCAYLLAAKNTGYLGIFPSCHYAIIEAKKSYFNVDGCYYCCNDCHTR